MPIPEPEPWMKAAARLANDALDEGDEKTYRRVMDAAEARADQEAAESRRQRGL